MDVNPQQREIVTIHIGQAGVQIGHAFWELLSAEHSISSNGKKNNEMVTGENYTTFFNECFRGQLTPRALFIDLDPSIIDEMRTGVYRNLYHPDTLINGKDDAANNFARGYYTTGTQLISKYTNETRKLIEECENVLGLFIIHSLGGGTGSGVCGKFMEHASYEYAKVCKIEVPIIPSPTVCNAVVEPYNTALSCHFDMEFTDLALPLDNEAMFDICDSRINVRGPTFANINRMVAILISCLTCSIRFESVLSCDLTQMQTNLVPFPRIHFPITTFAPMLSHDRLIHDNLTTLQLTREIFRPKSHFVKLQGNSGQFMSVALMYRGLITPKEVHESLNKLKSDTINFVDWCPTGFKVSLNYQSPTLLPQSQMAMANRFVCMLGNSTAIADVFFRLSNKCAMLYKKRSFVHWYVGEGLEESEINESMQNVESLAQDYKECGSPNNAVTMNSPNSNITQS